MLSHQILLFRQQRAGGSATRAAQRNRPPTMRAVLGLLPVLAAGKSVIPIMDWSLDYGYCKAAAPWLRREQLEPVSAEVGDIIDVRYAASGAMSGHDVRKYPDEESWLACDESKSTLLTTAEEDGGGCATSHDSSSGYLRTSWPLMAPEAAYRTSIMSPTSADTGSSCSRRSHGAAALQ